MYKLKEYKVFIYMLVVIAGFSSLTCSRNSNVLDVAASPNILWIVLEDTAPLLGCYGETIISTPHIDQLAADGVLYKNAIMPAPVCSPCRSSIITGMMSTTLGTHNHHSARTEESAIHLPDYVRTIPELFKEAGYFTFNNGKDDYNFTYNRMDLYSQEYQEHPLYGKKGTPVDLKSLSDKIPFFGQIQLSGGKEIFNSKFKNNIKNPVDRSKIKLPPYLPDHPVIVEEYADHLDAIEITDGKVGAIIHELRESGLLKNTIVFFFSDHGMRLTRNKQFLYEGGLRVPLIVADYTNSKHIRPGTTFSGLVSGLDLGPSALGLSDIAIPAHLEGVNIFDESNDKRDFVISTRDRCDFTIDRIRSVRTKNYKYIRNFMVDRPYTQPTYMDVDGVPFVKTMKQLYRENKLDSIQAIFYNEARPSEELYKLRDDPFEINNLALNPDYVEELEKHSDILNQWIVETDDKGQYPENEENLKLMLGIWGKHAVNPEYEALRMKYPTLASSQFWLKNEKWKEIDHN